MSDTPPIPAEIKAANRRRALELAAQAPGTHPAEFAAAMRTVFLPRYREVLEEEQRTREAAKDDD